MDSGDEVAPPLPADKAKAGTTWKEWRKEFWGWGDSNESRIAAAQKSAAEEATLAAERARDQLRDQVAQLAVSGAERILKREIDAKQHADLLSNLKNELR